ncbi:MAG: redoxin domain-containing protein [Deltaproteobacteria bacterium]|nr:redoxin domain-containing protein [Deltaproteobacteria bacterium]
MKNDDLAPELDGAQAWLNVERPLSLRELRGCVVLLDFWTYCCVNCMHVLPTLRAIERRHRRDPLVVIGVHSGKFSAERDPERIREAIGRYGVEHPVVVDEEMTIWSRYEIRSWPTVVVVRPSGTVAAVAPGEPDPATLEAFVQRELDRAKADGTLALGPPRIRARRPPGHQPLCYPGKVSVLPDGRLAVSDSGHQRVLVCAPDGQVLAAVGSGLRGLRDGPLAEAAFDDPQGSCWHDGALYVADARNHAVRRVDLAAGRVSTVAGTGRLGTEPPRGRAPAVDVALRSPWDVCSVGEAIYVAMAGSHQIWRLWPRAGQIEIYAGTGVEALLDGPVRKSAWAQPSGLSARGSTLYVADSETSAVRAIDLGRDEVRTPVGQGLFDFGDGEGDADAALLQHCLGVAAVADGVLVADTYNGKIKRLTEGEPGQIRTALGGLSEPGSVAVAPDGSWIVADTNAHRVLRVRGAQVEEIALRGAPEPHLSEIDPIPEPEPPPSSVDGWFTALLALAPGLGLGRGAGLVSLELRAQGGAELAPGSPIRVALEVSRRSDLLVLECDRLSLDAAGGATQQIDVAVHVTKLPAPVVEAELVARLGLVSCDGGAPDVCTPRELHLRVPVRLLGSGGTDRIAFVVPLPAAEARRGS